MHLQPTDCYAINYCRAYSLWTLQQVSGYGESHQLISQRIYFMLHDTLNTHWPYICCLYEEVKQEIITRLLLCVQFAFNTLQRVSPVSHGVCNVVKRVAIIVSSVIFFGTPLSTKTKLGKFTFLQTIHKPEITQFQSQMNAIDFMEYNHLIKTEVSNWMLLHIVNEIGNRIWRLVPGYRSWLASLWNMLPFSVLDHV